MDLALSDMAIAPKLCFLRVNLKCIYDKPDNKHWGGTIFANRAMHDWWMLHGGFHKNHEKMRYNQWMIG